MWVQSLGQKNPQEEGMATHSSILAWRILWTEEPGGLQFMGSKMRWTQLKQLSTHGYHLYHSNSIFTNLKFIFKGNHIITLSSLFMVYNHEYNIVTKINVIQTMRSAPWRQWFVTYCYIPSTQNSTWHVTGTQHIFSEWGTGKWINMEKNAWPGRGCSEKL